MTDSSTPGTPSTPSFLDQLLDDAPETLPILRQSCIQVLNLTQDKRSSASDIGDVIRHDQAMMANIIKIANSPAYCTRVPVKTSTHAVALIGFDVIQAMVVAAQLIEQADAFGANTSYLKHLLARALVAGTQAQELGKTLKYQETGMLFTNAMLYSLGDFILALCRPEIAEQLETLRLEDPSKVPKAELALLGRPLRVIAATMAKHWHLPDTLVQLLGKKPFWPHTRPETDQQIMEGIVRGANELSHCLLNPTAPGQNEVFQTLMKQFLPSFGISFSQLDETVNHAFMQASEIANSINIPQHHLRPAADSEGQPIHNQQLHQLTNTVQQAVHSEHPSEQEEESVPYQQPPIHPAPSSSDQSLLDYTLQSMKINEPSTLLTFATQTLYATLGFERVLLSFIVPGKEKLEAKICHGANSDSIQTTFHCPLTKGKFWHQLLHQFQPVQFHSLIKEAEPIGVIQDFLQHWGGGPGFAGPLYAPNKPIGLILVDHGSTGKELTDTDFATFSLILSHTNANLARLAQHH